MSDAHTDKGREAVLGMVRAIRRKLARSPGLGEAPFSDEGWATIEAALSATPSAVAAIDEWAMTGRDFDACEKLYAGSIKCSDDLPVDQRPETKAGKRMFRYIHALVRGAHVSATRIEALEAENARMRRALDLIYNHNEAARAAVIQHYGLWHDRPDSTPSPTAGSTSSAIAASDEGCGHPFCEHCDGPAMSMGGCKWHGCPIKNNPADSRSAPK